MLELNIHICTSGRIVTNRIVMLKEEIIRNEFLEAARLLFQQYGLQKTTMEYIARALGKGKSTLYYYYANKDEVFQAVVLKEIDEVSKAVHQKVIEAQTAKEKLTAYAANNINEIKGKTILYKLVCGELKGNLTKKMFNLRGQFDAKEIEILKEILAFGVNSKEFSSIKIEDINILAHLISSALRGIEVDMFIENKIPNLEDQIDHLLGILIRGLA